MLIFLIVIVTCKSAFSAIPDESVPRIKADVENKEHQENTKKSKIRVTLTRSNEVLTNSDDGSIPLLNARKEKAFNNDFFAELHFEEDDTDESSTPSDDEDEEYHYYRMPRIDLEQLKKELEIELERSERALKRLEHEEEKAKKNVLEARQRLELVKAELAR